MKSSKGLQLIRFRWDNRTACGSLFLRSPVCDSHRAAAIMPLSGAGRLPHRHFVSRPTAKEKTAWRKKRHALYNAAAVAEAPFLDLIRGEYRQTTSISNVEIPTRLKCQKNKAKIVSDAAEIAPKWTSCDNMFRWLTLLLLCVFTGMTLFCWRAEPPRTLNATQIHIFFFK